MAVAVEGAQRRALNHEPLHGLGPAATVSLALRRIDWSARTCRHWTMDNGEEIDVGKVGPGTMRKLVRSSVTRKQWRLAEEGSPSRGIGGGACTSMARRLFSKFSTS